MTSSEFDQLKEKEKLAFLWKNGSFLLNRVEGGKRLALFRIDEFFIEVRYNYTTSARESVTTLSRVKEIGKYLKHFGD